MKPIRLLILSLSLFLNQTIMAEETYKIDPAHADIGFLVDHLVINKVRGKFREFQGSLTLDDKGNLVAAEATIKIASIDTEIEARDVHLRSADFFDVEKFPEMTFQSTKVKGRVGKDVLFGALTIKGVTKRVALPFQVKGPIIDPWGNKKIGFEAGTTINRKDFGLTWNQALESGGVMVGEEITIVINLEAALVE